MSIQVPCSIGELWDKCSILLIKKEKDEFLFNKMNPEYYTHKLFLRLKVVNEHLWEIENKLRIKEKDNEFDAFFIELARSMLYKNDKREEIKNEINTLFNCL